MPSTSEINQKLLAPQSDEAEPRSSIFSNWNTTDIFLTTAINSVATLCGPITDLFSFEELAPEFFYGLSWAGIGITLPIALAFAYCVANKHAAENALIDNYQQSSSNPSDLEAGMPSELQEEKLDTSITGSQRLKLVVHTVADVTTALAPLVLVGEQFKTQVKLGYRVGVYATSGLWKVGANMQEYFNGKNSYERENREEAMRKRAGR